MGKKAKGKHRLDKYYDLAKAQGVLSVIETGFILAICRARLHASSS